MATNEDAGSTIGQSAARLAWDYCEALVRAGGDDRLVPLCLPEGWVKLAGKTAQLLVIEAIRQYEAREAERGRLEQRELCVHCGSMHFGIFYDPAAQGSHVECSRCGKVRLV
jgi:hypothetical protein